MPFSKEHLEQEIIRLKNYGYTYAEIANRLQIPESSVRHVVTKQSKQ